MSAIYVSGFTFEGVGEGDARREAFDTAFGGYGKITSVKVAGKDKPFAFVTFADEESRDKAVAAGAATLGGAECEVAAQTSVTKAKKPKKPRNSKKENKAPAAKKPAGFAIYVRGFTFEGVGEGDARREAFNTAFGGYGEITSVKVSGKDKPYAFVTFSDEESRDRAVAAGAATLGGAECEVAAQTKREKRAPAAKKPAGFAIYVSGFTFEGVGEGNARREAFNTAFGGYGEITNVKVSGKDKPYAFVTFSDEESRDKAVAAGPATLGGAECEIAAQTSTPKPKARKNKNRKPRKRAVDSEDA
jgi:RNA recognition motif-containing protein